MGVTGLVGMTGLMGMTRTQGPLLCLTRMNSRTTQLRTSRLTTVRVVPQAV